MKKKLLVFFVTIIAIFSAFPVSALAADYPDEYPQNIPYSGGAYIYANSDTFGVCTIVFPVEYKDGYFGFVGSGRAAVGNLSNNTIYGTLYVSNTRSYQIRASSWGNIEYRADNNYNWYNINLTEIKATNINLIDYQSDRGTSFQKFDFDYEDKFIIFLLLAMLLINIIEVVKK